MSTLPRFRPLKWWLPETLNRLRAPAWLMRRARRSETAQIIRQARRDGLGYLFKGDYMVARNIRSRAPARR